MTFDLDFAYTHARFTDFDPAGDRIPGAPAVVASGGVTSAATPAGSAPCARAILAHVR